jgi:putative transposase
MRTELAPFNVTALRAPLKCCQFSVESVSQGDGQIKRSRFSEEQIVGTIKEQEPGAVTADVCRRHGISEATFYKWKAKFGGLEVTEDKRLRTLEEENAKLKKLLTARAVSPDRRRLPASRNSFDQA